MTVDFDKDRWEKIKEDSDKWWAGELKRPLINVVLHGGEGGRPEPRLPRYEFTSFYDSSVPAQEIVDRWDYDLCRRKFLGDAFPCVWPNFGPGVAVAFMGAELHNGQSTVWFQPGEQKEARELSLRYDAQNVWLRRVKNICRAAVEYWQGLVQVSMTDLGGNLDLVAAFRPGDKLLLDLYDCPDEVKRLTWEAHELWWRYYDELNSLLQPVNPGYSAWASIFSTQPYYMLQCNFAYMISPQMFDEFVRPELVSSCRRLANSFFHLDGPGQLPHLDSVLGIPELKGIQWVPGEGASPQSEWPRYTAGFAGPESLFNSSGAWTCSIRWRDSWAAPRESI